MLCIQASLWPVQEYEERSNRIKKLREDFGSHSNALEALTAQVEDAKVCSHASDAQSDSFHVLVHMLSGEVHDT